ncbi:hypothetical protein WOLCODRAFT_25751 [Wolfiporia cocos MD-104 SS10]|uniref:Uncharacterized protein n=1 Tax=Wolfiporia cocos (strain MD-104) TaxID=742152 RepID=A0A2H3JLS5_WOLCO|nr:hypothetical protein WOLCODRAFT_25751 [Wolfiporia cocos MD-104 SS10]
MDRRPLLALPPKQSFGTVPPAQTYGYGTTQGASSARGSPEQHRRNSLLAEVPEEVGFADTDIEEEELELELEERGYYIGSYKRKVALYSLVPISSIFVFVILAVAPSLIWRPDQPSPPAHTRSFSSPLPELLVTIALWSLSYLLRMPIYNLASAVFPIPLLQSLLFNTVYVLLSQLLRLSAVPILHIRYEMQYPLPTWRDPAFHRVWWVALGWALADVTVGIAQGYEQLALYRDAMVPEAHARDVLMRWRYAYEGAQTRRSQISPDEALRMSPRSLHENEDLDGTRKSEAALRLAVDQDFEQLVRLKDREELEDIYGIPPIKIPVFVSCLQRLDAFVLSLGMTLIVSAAYLRAPLAFPDGKSLPPIYTNSALAAAFPLIIVVHLVLALLHTPPVLARVGVHTTAYVGLLVGLGSVFTGLGLWGALS